VRPPGGDATDEELWRRSADHDGAAFGLLFERHVNAVYNHCFRRTASWSRAEDLTSVVFLELWRQRSRVRLDGDSILPWLFGVANNVIRNADRSLRRYHRLLIKLATVGPPQAPADEDFGQRVDDERSMAHILEAVSTLRTEEQEVVALCDWANLTYAEAAASLDVPIGTIRSRLSRAHEHLRETIDRDGNRWRQPLLSPPHPSKENDGVP